MTQVAREIPVVLGEMLQGMNEAAACCSGMIGSRPDSQWFFLRDVIEACRAMIVDQCVDPMLATPVRSTEAKNVD